MAELLMIKEAAVGYFGAPVSAAEVAATLDLNLELTRSGHGASWVSLHSKDEQRIIAYAAVSFGQLSYCVNPEHWRRGVATNLLRVVAADASARWPNDTLSASVSRENVASARLLESLDYRFVRLERHRSSKVMLIYELGPT